ncbi:MAG: DUF6159 family protein [Actinomycetota bacterium]
MVLARASWTTLRADRELLSLPIFSFLASLVTAGVFFGLAYVADPDLFSNLSEEGATQSPALIVFGILTGVFLAIISTYFQAAMVSGALERLRGGDPTVGSAIGSANAHLGVIIPWALFRWTVGAILQLIEERFGAVGRIVSGLAGAAFQIVTFLAVPIIIVEDLGPIDTLKRSGQLFKRTWGENLLAQFGLGIVSFVALLVGIIPAALIAAAISPIVGIVLGVLWVAAVIVVTTSLTAVYQTALYEYATTGEIPSTFQDVGFDTAFSPK